MSQTAAKRKATIKTTEIKHVDLKVVDYFTVNTRGNMRFLQPTQQWRWTSTPGDGPVYQETN